MSAGTVFDRTVEPAWLDQTLTLRIDDPATARKRLDLWMTDQVASVAGREKTMSVLVRTWIEPRPPAEPMIRWAATQAPRRQEWGCLHLGALFAAYPFFGSACGVIGHEIALHGEIRTAAVCQRLRETWGDRGVIDVGGQSVTRTLRAFGVLEGRKGGKSASQGARIPVPADLSLWIAHALQLTRRVDEVDLRDLRSAPELFMFEFHGQSSSYPLGDVFAEGGGRRVFRGERNDHMGREVGPQTLQLFS
jgi:hypothetical protein